MYGAVKEHLLLLVSCCIGLHRDVHETLVTSHLSEPNPNMKMGFPLLLHIAFFLFPLKLHNAQRRTLYSRHLKTPSFNAGH